MEEDIGGMSDREVLDHIFHLAGFERVSIQEFNSVNLINPEAA